MPERKQASGRTGRGLAPVRRGRKSPLRPSPGQFRFLERKAFLWQIELQEGSLGSLLHDLNKTDRVP